MLYDIALKHRLVIENAVKTESAQVDGLILVVHDVLHDGASYGRGLLDAVPAAPRRHDHIHVVRVVPNDQILVKVVVVVKTGPRTLQLQD